MAIRNRKTVWILGAGFSRSLGGPLLTDMFRQEVEGDVAQFYASLGSQDLARQLVWVQAIYNFGRADTERRWENAEEFLAFVDAATGDAPTPLAQATLRGIIERCRIAPDPIRPETTKPGNDGMFACCVQDICRTVHRALAVECSRFLWAVTTVDERWYPYSEWANSLDENLDTVITFNYDSALSRIPGVGGVFRFLLPGRNPPSPGVPVFHLHGCVEWERGNNGVQRSRLEAILAQNRSPAIAAPGRSKMSGIDESYWEQAMKKLREADAVAIVGYSFPKTDAFARMKLLESLGAFNGRNTRLISIVLGPNVSSPESQRVLELVRYRTGQSRNVLVDPTDKQRDAAQDLVGGITEIRRHRLWAEDFLGDYKDRM